MDPIQDTVTPVPPAPVEAPKKSSMGATVGLVIILAAVVYGAWYFWNQRSGTETAVDVSALEEQGTSTDPAAIEADLTAQSPEDFDKGIDEAFGELDASFESN